MPRRKFIDKKNATTFQLLHRSQNDPLIHDSEASQFVFAEKVDPRSNVQSISYPSSSGASAVSHSSYASQLRRARANASRGDLESEYGGSVRANEGEAAEHGIYYDDTDYDYMQHMRDLNAGGGDATWVDAPGTKKQGKNKQKLEDMLREVSISDSVSQNGSLASGFSMSSHAATDVFSEKMLPSEFVRPTSYQDQQNVPDAIAGFQPDMDPRLREVLEALEDEAYVDEGEEGDFFEELTGEGAEVDQYEWEDGAYQDELLAEEDDGWETDDTIKPENELRSPKLKTTVPSEEQQADVDGVPLPAPDEAPADREDTDWQSEFAKFKASGKAPRPEKQLNVPVDMQSNSILTGASSLLTSGRKKKRKGAMTSTSGYSMSSSALVRTEAMSILDQRFEKIEEEYADDYMPDDGASLASGMTGASKMSSMSKMSSASRMTTASAMSAMRSDFDGLVDDFLGTHSVKAKKYVKRGKQQSGMEELDEIRKGLGPARVARTQKA